jgi:hypothetical protein
MSFVGAPDLDFGPTLLRGLVALEPCEPQEEDLSLTLGLSLWMHRSGTNLEEARTTMLELRALLLDVGGMDRRTEPIPLLGRSERVDVLSLAAYVGDLLLRAAATARCEPEEVAQKVVARLGTRTPRFRSRPARAG